MRYPLPPLLFSLVLACFASAQTNPITPNTTLAEQTGNNTSAADSFQEQYTGNAGAGNVSKVDTRTLLYAGADTKLYVYLQGWFGRTNHMDVGYRSDDPAQVQRQIADMRSRGFQGAIVDWYGPEFTLENASALQVRDKAQANSPFEFALLFNFLGVRRCSQTAGCDVTGKLIEILEYARQNFVSSSAYMRVDGRPVVFFFGQGAYNIDWNRTRAAVESWNPVFVFRFIDPKTNAFDYVQSDGAFAWLRTATGNPDFADLSYLDEFYTTALNRPSQYAWGSAYKGFNDDLASWKTTTRYINQRCGQTWLDTFARAGKYYSAASQLDALAVVTWNDNEEATSIESGIENCVTVSASVLGSRLDWSITGQQNTIDHFTVFISEDGENLMSLGDFAASERSLDLGQFGFRPALYKVQVKAVGRPSLTNKMSAAARFKAQYVVIDSPQAGQTSTSPVNIAARALSPVTVTQMRLLLDGKTVHTSSGATLNVSIAAKPGSRTFTVVARDAEDSEFQSSVTVRITKK